MIPGCDLASWQGPPPWQVSAASIDWAAVKLTELQPGGISYRDPDAPDDWRYLKDLGKGRIAYLFARPATPVTATVALFCGMCDALGLAGGDGIALDHETTDGLSAAEVSQWAADVLALMERELGRRPLIYTYLDFAWSGNCAGLGGYPLWISDPSSPPGRPRVPAPWTTWKIHQYATTGPVDRDVAAWPSLADMRAAIGRPGPPLRPEDDDMPIQLNRGAGAQTPVTLTGQKYARFFPGRGNVADLRVDFGQDPPQDLRLDGTAEKLPVPPGANGITVTRLDDGPHDVSVALFG